MTQHYSELIPGTMYQLPLGAAEYDLTDDLCHSYIGCFIPNTVVMYLRTLPDTGLAVVLYGERVTLICDYRLVPENILTTGLP